MLFTYSATKVGALWARVNISAHIDNIMIGFRVVNL
jgi:hypothetical protein